MKRIVAWLLALIVIISITGCADLLDAPTEPEELSRFTVEEIYRPGSSAQGLYILTDEETGVQYLIYNSVHGTGMCKLEG